MSQWFGLLPIQKSPKLMCAKVAVRSCSVELLDFLKLSGLQLTGPISFKMTSCTLSENNNNKKSHFTNI